MHSNQRACEFVSVTEAARILGISRRGVLHRIKAGRLPATKLGAHTSAFVVKRDDLPRDEGSPE